MHRLVSMHFVIITTVAAVVLAVAMVVLFQVGRRIGGARRTSDLGEAAASGALDAAIFGLLGLLIAFTFSGAADRFDARRRMIIDERNAIEAAYLKLDLLPARERAHLQQQVRLYLDLRLDLYRVISDVATAQRVWDHTRAVQREMWADLTSAVRAPGTPNALPVLVLPAFTNMFDQAATRMISLQIHPPIVVYGMLFALALLSALIAGLGLARRKPGVWLYGVAYSIVIPLVAFVIINFEAPRLGVIHVGNFDSVLGELQSDLRASTPTTAE